MRCDYFVCHLLAQLMFLAKYFENMDYTTYHVYSEWVRKVIKESYLDEKDFPMTKELLHNIDKEYKKINGYTLFDWEDENE